MFISRVLSTMNSTNMNLNKTACGLAISTAILLGSTALPNTQVFAQCQNGTAESAMMIPASKPGSTETRTVTTTTAETAPDYVLQAETAMTPRTFEHESFSLRSIVKAAVSVYPANAKNQISGYESIWFQDGSPIGLERASTLKIPADKNVQIKVVQSPCATFDESKAAGNTIMRLVLDILKNHDKVAVVSVPSASYTNILMELQRRRMSVMPPGEKAPESAKVKFKLESESTGMSQEVYFI